MSQEPEAPPRTPYDESQTSPLAPPDSAPLSELLAVLDLQRLGEARTRLQGVGGDEESDLGESVAEVFVGQSHQMPHGRVFGGQVLAQAVVAAGRTVQGVGAVPRPIHSLHAYFVRAGDDHHPIRFAVERIRDGRSFSTRRVQAIQYGKPILSMITSFQEPAGGMDHQDPMPAAPDPETLPSLQDLARRLGESSAGAFARARSIDLRHVGSDLYTEPAPDRVAHQQVWLKAVERLPDDPLLHAAVLAYCSDYSLLEPIIRRHGYAWSDERLRPASLDHAMWFHREGRADDWVLYTQESPSAQGGRGLATGRMFSADGRLVASVAQEGMVRIKES